jgi:DNA-binding NarL/FixJ family response regulator
MIIRLVIAENHPLMLNGLENLFRMEDDFHIEVLCTNTIDTLEAVRRHKPDVLILAIHNPGKDGLMVARELHADVLIPTRIVFYTAEIDEDQLLEAVRMSVAGIVLKEMDPQLLVQCVRKVHAGEQWIERRAAMLSFEKLLRQEAGAREISSLLTSRETAILRMVARGLRNGQIGEELFISEGTVKVHLHNIYEKLQLKSRMALLRFAQEKGLVDFTPSPKAVIISKTS